MIIPINNLCLLQTVFHDLVCKQQIESEGREITKTTSLVVLNCSGKCWNICFAVADNARTHAVRPCWKLLLHGGGGGEVHHCRPNKSVGRRHDTLSQCWIILEYFSHSEDKYCQYCIVYSVYYRLPTVGITEKERRRRKGICGWTKGVQDLKGSKGIYGQGGINGSNSQVKMNRRRKEWISGKELME